MQLTNLIDVALLYPRTKTGILKNQHGHDTTTEISLARDI